LLESAPGRERYQRVFDLIKIRGAKPRFGNLFSCFFSITALITKNGVVIERDSRAFESTLRNVFRLLRIVAVRKCHEEGFTT
jgi:hypothetical protein